MPPYFLVQQQLRKETPQLQIMLELTGTQFPQHLELRQVRQQL